MKGSEGAIAAKLKSLSSSPLKVTWHDNRSLYLRIQKQFGILHLHLHRLFLEAPSPVLEALIRYSQKGRAVDKTPLRQMAHLYFSKRKVLSPALESKGTHYDLRPMLEAHQETYFSSKIAADIGWFEKPTYRKFCSMTFGTYDRTRGQIRLNRLLDSPDVPSYFVAFIVYHEMLHEVCQPFIDRAGRIVVHTAEFRRREKLFQDFDLAKKWEKSSLQFFKKKGRYGRA